MGLLNTGGDREARGQLWVQMACARVAGRPGGLFWAVLGCEELRRSRCLVRCAKGP
jgi:hypothetical protein